MPASLSYLGDVSRVGLVLLGDGEDDHAWIIEPWLQQYDVFANHHPCLKKTTAPMQTQQTPAGSKQCTAEQNNDS